MLVGNDGHARLDVNATFQTHDRALIYLEYRGIVEVTLAILTNAGGGNLSVEFGDQYFFTNPRFETSDERYAWLNTTFFVSQGELSPGPKVEYRVFSLNN